MSCNHIGRIIYTGKMYEIIFFVSFSIFVSSSTSKGILNLLEENHIPVIYSQYDEVSNTLQVSVNGSPMANVSLAFIADELVRQTTAVQLATCPYTPLCHVSLRDNLPSFFDGFFELPCCGWCSCGTSCFKTNHCCPDILNSLQNAKRQTECVHGQYRPYASFKYNSDRTYEMVINCHHRDSLFDSQLEDRCTFPGYLLQSNSTKPEDILPVTDSNEHFTYKNKYCAICNGVQESELVFWKPLVSCQFQPLFFSNFADLLDQIKENVLCNIFYIPPKSLSPVIDQCNGPYIRTCNVTGLWQTYDPFIEAACMSYTSLYKSYQNIFCSICNGFQPNGSDCYFGGGPSPSFIALIDFNQLDYGRQDKYEDHENRLCDSDERFDDYQGVCRKIHCPPMMRLADGQCQELFYEARMVAYQISAKLVPKEKIPAALSTIVEFLLHSKLTNLTLNISLDEEPSPFGDGVCMMNAYIKLQNLNIVTPFPGNYIEYVAVKAIIVVYSRHNSTQMLARLKSLYNSNFVLSAGTNPTLFVFNFRADYEVFNWTQYEKYWYTPYYFNPFPPDTSQTRRYDPPASDITTSVGSATSSTQQSHAPTYDPPASDITASVGSATSSTQQYHTQDKRLLSSSGLPQPIVTEVTPSDDSQAEPALLPLIQTTTFVKSEPGKTASNNNNYEQIRVSSTTPHSLSTSSSKGHKGSLPFSDSYRNKSTDCLYNKTSYLDTNDSHHHVDNYSGSAECFDQQVWEKVSGMPLASTFHQSLSSVIQDWYTDQSDGGIIIPLPQKTKNVFACSEPIVVTPILFCPYIKLYQREYSFHFDNERLIISELHLVLHPWQYATDDVEKVFVVCMEPFFASQSQSRDKSAPTSPVKITLTLICIVLSILCLVITFITYCIFKKLRSLPGKNVMALVLSLLLTDILLVVYIIGQVEAHFPTGCKIVGVLLHFCLLSSFMWMNVCTFHMAKMFTGRTRVAARYETVSNFVCYCVYCHLSATAFVLLNVVMSLIQTDMRDMGYGGSTCYISSRQNLMITVSVPLGIVVVANLTMFLLVMIKIKNMPTVEKAVKHDRKNTIIFAKLSTLTGITWTFAFLYNWTRFVVFEYAFIVLNGSHGVFIMLSFVLNKRVYNMYRTFFVKHSGSEESHLRTNSSHHSHDAHQVTNHTNWTYTKRKTARREGIELVEHNQLFNRTFCNVTDDVKELVQLTSARIVHESERIAQNQTIDMAHRGGELEIHSQIIDEYIPKRNKSTVDTSNLAEDMDARNAVTKRDKIDKGKGRMMSSELIPCTMYIKCNDHEDNHSYCGNRRYVQCNNDCQGISELEPSRSHYPVVTETTKL